jgi:hypothetical protein
MTGGRQDKGIEVGLTMQRLMLLTANVTGSHRSIKVCMDVIGVDCRPGQIGLGPGFHGHLRVDPQTESTCHFQRVHNMKIVRPGFCEVFPRMGGGVSADEITLPLAMAGPLA